MNEINILINDINTKKQKLKEIILNSDMSYVDKYRLLVDNHIITKTQRWMFRPKLYEKYFSKQSFGRYEQVDLLSEIENILLEENDIYVEDGNNIDYLYFCNHIAKQCIEEEICSFTFDW